MAKQQFSQHRRGLKVTFSLSPLHLDYRIEKKREVAFEKRIAWESIGARSTYHAEIEEDRDLRQAIWFLTVMAIFETVVGKSQPLTFMLLVGLMLTVLVGLVLSSRFRRLAYTRIPASDIGMLVIADGQHDHIVAAIESARAARLRALVEAEPNESIRMRLRGLRWLAQAGAIDADEYEREQSLHLPEPIIAASRRPAPPPTVEYRQRRLGVSIDVSLLGDRLAYRRSTLLEGTASFTLLYRNLPEARSLIGEDHQPVLSAFLCAWIGIAMLSIVLPTMNGSPPGYYIGNTGLQHAIVLFGPAFIAWFALAWIIWLVLRARYHHPWDGVLILADRTGDQILAEIEARRIAALRALAVPDPLATLEEQMTTLTFLKEDGLISAEEFERAAQAADFVCEDESLDAPTSNSEPVRVLH
ncbi:MAG TPA: hypothetical protein VG900_00510 [Hyphomicrobiaceae bacterium]|nr:hypothetical protein [Hyphomicrobiaceae bacterium]